MLTRSTTPVALFSLLVFTNAQLHDLYGRESESLAYNDPSQLVAFDKRTPDNGLDHESFMEKRYAEPEFEFDAYGYDLYARDADPKLDFERLGNKAQGLGNQAQGMGNNAQQYQNQLGSAGSSLYRAGTNFVDKLKGQPLNHRRYAQPEPDLDELYLYARDPYENVEALDLYARDADAKLDFADLGNKAQGLGSHAQGLANGAQQYQDRLNGAKSGLIQAGKKYLNSQLNPDGTGSGLMHAGKNLVNTLQGQAPLRQRDADPEFELDDLPLYARDFYDDVDTFDIYAREAQRKNSISNLFGSKSSSPPSGSAAPAPAPPKSPNSKDNKQLAHHAIDQVPSLFQAVPDMIRAMHKSQRRNGYDASQELYSRDPQAWEYLMQLSERSPEAEAAPQPDPEADAEADADPDADPDFDELFAREADAEPDFDDEF